MMDKDTLVKIRDKSDSWRAYKANKIKSCVWVEWHGEMSRKAVVKRLVKYLPKTNKLRSAIESDNREYGASLSQKGLLESLLATSMVSEDEKDRILDNLEDMNYYEVSRCIDYLKENQSNNVIRDWGIGNKTQISEAVNLQVDRKNT